MTNEPTIWSIAFLHFGFPAAPARDWSQQAVFLFTESFVVLFDDVTHMVVHFDEALTAVRAFVLRLVF
jgi:hypothetical protein